MKSVLVKIVEQLDLFKFSIDRLHTIENQLSNRLQKQVRVIPTRNRSHLITVRKSGVHSVHLRVQEIFLHAPDDVWSAIGTFMLSPTPDSRRVIRGYISGIRPSPGVNVSSRQGKVSLQGKCFNLGDIFDELNRSYFNGEIQCGITWGKVYRKRRRRSISFGNYEGFSNMIKINPALDRSEVPRFFVEYIVYHEMIHARIDRHPDRKTNHRIHHGDDFYREEKQFRDYEEALAWEKRNMALFVR